MLGRIVGPIHPPSAVQCGTQVSPIGVIPKSNQRGKWRLIVDLSSPEGRSVNAGIEPELCSMHYLRLDEVVQQISKAGQGALLAKMDIDSAYRNVPVHPADRPLLGMQWKGSIFFDTRLPFGLRSAPKIFSAVADALQWSFQRRGVSWVAHYLDDFITVGSPGSPECQTNLGIMLATCQRLGVPVAQKKCAGPATVLVFLGFELNTNQMGDKVARGQVASHAVLGQGLAGQEGMQEERPRVSLETLAACSDSGTPGRTFDRTGFNGADTGSVDSPEFVYSFRPELVVCFYGEVEWSLHGSKSFNASHPTGDGRLWLLGLRSPLGIMVVAVEMGRSIYRVAYLSKRASPNSLCGSNMGRALGGTASGMPL